MHSIMSPRKPDPEKEAKLHPKAGMFIHGWALDKNRQRRMHVLTSYTEGRFGDNDKYYGLPKGAVDPGESYLQTAIREAQEETGIDLARLMGKKAFEQFARGETIENIESPDPAYQGVRIIKASGQPVREHTYVSIHGVPNHTLYFSIELEGIEKLQGSCKKMSDGETPNLSTLRVTSAQLAAERKLPTLNEMLEIMRTGVVPGRADCQWADKTPQRIMERPVLPGIEKAWLRTQRRNGKVTTLKEWLDLCEQTPGADYKKLEQDFKTIKSYMEGRGVIGDNGQLMKLDIKDRPLCFYVEGAEVLPLNDMINRSLDCAKKSPLYARAMWGDYEGRRRPVADEKTRMESAQIAPFIDYMSTFPDVTMEIADAALRLPRHAEERYKVGGHPIDPRGLRAVDYASGIRSTPLLEAIQTGQSTSPQSARR